MNDKKDNVYEDGIPMGLGMALAKNSKAMEYFSALSEQDKQAVIAGTHGINSKDEMRSYVNRMAGQDLQG